MTSIWVISLGHLEEAGIYIYTWDSGIGYDDVG